MGTLASKILAALFIGLAATPAMAAGTRCESLFVLAPADAKALVRQLAELRVAAEAAQTRGDHSSASTLYGHFKRLIGQAKADGVDLSKLQSEIEAARTSHDRTQSENSRRERDTATNEKKFSPLEMKRELTELGTPTSLSFTADGARMLGATEGGDLLVWETANWTPLPTMADGVQRLLFAKMSDDGTRAAVVADYGGSVVFDVGTGQQIAKLGEKNDKRSFHGFSADGRRMMTNTADGWNQIWDVDKKKQLAKFKAGQYNMFVELSPDGKRVFVSALQGQIHVYDATTGEQRKDFVGHTQYPQQMTFSPDGSMLLTRAAQELILWNAKTGKKLFKVPCENVARAPIAMSPNGELIATASTDGVVTVWRKDGTRVADLSYTGEMHMLAFDHAGQRLAGGTEGKGVFLWDVSAGAVAQKIVIREDGQAALVRALAFHPVTGELIISTNADAKALTIWGQP